jgi:hypothetical protein
MTAINDPKAIINGGERRFRNEEELKEWIVGEISSWSWLTDAQSAYRAAMHEIYNSLFFTKLKPLLDRFDPTNVQYNNFSIGQPNDLYIESTSNEGLLINRIREQYGNITAALSLLFLNIQTRNLCGQSTAVRIFSEDASLSYERAVAIQINLSNADSTSIIGDARLDALNIALKNFNKFASESSEKITEHETDVIAHINKIKLSTNKSAAGIKRAFSRRFNAYKKSAEKVRTQAKENLLSSRFQLAAAKEAYEDQAALAASVTYWSTRQSTHTLWKGLWFFCAVNVMALTFAALLIYYSFGGISGISSILNEKPITQISTLSKINAASNSPITVEPIVTPPPQTMQSLVTATSRSELSLAIADIAGAALLITLMAVLIRITLRQFNTNSHLAQDAAERVTFTKTYLALLREGKLNSSEDRRLVLESLFRPSHTGGVTDTPFNSPIELVLKTIGGYKPPA